jgi:gamma-glutamylaminecyclotransferase
MTHQVFVYGTLKEGFRNFHINKGSRLPGEFVTVQRHALMIVGDHWLPWLLPEAQPQPQGLENHHVIGQVYSVDDAGLAEMDRLEQIDEPGWYLRRRIAVQPLARPDGSAVLHPWVYFGSPEGLAVQGRRLGPLAAFTLAHQELLSRAEWPKG